MGRHFGREEARRQVSRFRRLLAEPSEDLLWDAMDLKLARPGLSYADAIGYTTALDLGARFLTGDRAFRRMSNVEFRA